MTVFNNVFYSLLCSKIQKLPQKKSDRIDPNPTEGAHDKEKLLNLAPQNLPKCAISISQNKRICPLPRSLRPPTLNSRWRHWNIDLLMILLTAEENDNKLAYTYLWTLYRVSLRRSKTNNARQQYSVLLKRRSRARSLHELCCSMVERREPLWIWPDRRRLASRARHTSPTLAVVHIIPLGRVQSAPSSLLNWL